MAADNMSQLMGALGAWLEANPEGSTAASRDRATDLIFGGALLGVATRDVSDLALASLSETEHELLDDVRAWAYPDEDLARTPASNDEPEESVGAAPAEVEPEDAEPEDSVDAEPEDAEPEESVDAEPAEAKPEVEFEPDEPAEDDEPDEPVEDEAPPPTDLAPVAAGERKPSKAVPGPKPAAPRQRKKAKRVPRKQKKKLAPAAKQATAPPRTSTPVQTTPKVDAQPQPSATFTTLTLATAAPSSDLQELDAAAPKDTAAVDFETEIAAAAEAEAATSFETEIAAAAEAEAATSFETEIAAAAEAEAETSFETEIAAVSAIKRATPPTEGESELAVETEPEAASQPKDDTEIAVAVEADETEELQAERATRPTAWFSEELVWWFVCAVALAILIVRRLV